MGLFRKRPAPLAPAVSTGHEGDDQLLAQIASQSDLHAPRHWVHYLYVSDEGDARAAAEWITENGWGIQRVDPSADGGPDWVVIAEKHDAVLTPDAVRSARAFFEAVAADHRGGEYDGWEASV